MTKREKIIAAQEKLGLKPSEMAKALDTPYRTYMNWLSGSFAPPGVAVVAAELLVELSELREK